MDELSGVRKEKYFIENGVARKIRTELSKRNPYDVQSHCTEIST